MSRKRRAWSISASMRASICSTPPMCIRRAVGNDPRQGHRWTARQGFDLHESDVPHGRWPQRSGIVAPSSDPVMRSQPAAAGHRLHRHLSPARLRRAHAGGRSSEHAGQSGAERQGALHRVLEFFRMALDEVARRLRSLWLVAVRRPSGLLLADRPRIRMGTDAARTRSGSGRAGVESAGLGTADGKDSPRAAAAGRKPAAQDRREQVRRWRTNICIKVVDALDEVAKETGKTRSAGCVELAAAAADGFDRDHGRAQRRAVEAESRRRRDGT